MLFEYQRSTCCKCSVSPPAVHTQLGNGRLQKDQGLHSNEEPDAMHISKPSLLELRLLGEYIFL